MPAQLSRYQGTRTSQILEPGEEHQHTRADPCWQQSSGSWKCPNCSHEWQARIASRAEHNSGCPLCSQAQATQVTQPTFAAAEHALLQEWDCERNALNGLHPHSITLGSRKRVHWCVRNALKDSCTGIKCGPMIVLAVTLQGVHTVLASKHANATP